MGVGGQRHVPAALPLGKTRYPLCRRIGEPRGQLGRVRKILPPIGIRSRTPQPAVSRYTDYAIPAKLSFRMVRGFILKASRFRTRHEWSSRPVCTDYGEINHSDSNGL